MTSVEEDFNMRFLNQMEKDISEINKNFPKVLENLLELQYVKYQENLLNQISLFKQVLERKTDDQIYIQNTQKCYDVLKQKCKDYTDNILKIYENDFINNIKNCNKDLEYYINNINLSESKNSSINISTNNEIDEEDEKESLSLCNALKSNINDFYICSVCNQEKSFVFLDKCNQLFCKGCLDKAEKYDKDIKKCIHNAQSINEMKERDKIRKGLYLKSLKFFFKRIILKSNYLLNKQIEDVIIHGNNNSNIIVKKILFEYPIIDDINDINDSKEINFLNCINNILVNNLDINNIEINSFNIFEINKNLVNLLKDIFLNEEEIDDDDDNVKEDDITDEKYLKEIKENKFK